MTVEECVATAESIGFRKIRIGERGYQYASDVLAAKYGLVRRAVYLKTAVVPGWGDASLHDHFFIEIKRVSYADNGKEIVHATFDTVWHGSARDAETGKYRPPSMYDLLACIQKNEIGTFEDFCRDFGYDTDSRKAEALYNACVKEYKDFSALFPEGIPEDILDIA